MRCLVLVFLTGLLSAATPARATSPELSDAWVRIGAALSEARFAEAETIAKAAVDLAERQHGVMSADYASSADYLASAYLQERRFDEAETVRLRVLAIREGLFGPDSDFVANTLNELGFIYYVQGEFGQAEPVYSRALRIREKTEPNSLGVASDLDVLASVERALGRPLDATDLTDRARTIKMNVGGPFASQRLITPLPQLMPASEERAATPPVPSVFFASLSGRETLDQGDGGGNPFASALVELLSRPDMTLGALPSELRKLTDRNSRGFQAADGPSRIEPANWRFQTRQVGETRVALVVVFSNYTSSAEWPALPGARRDANRVRTALEAAGFQTTTIVDPDHDELSDVLRKFRRRSATADFAVIYATGHGVEFNRRVYLMPGDYPFTRGSRALAQSAVPLSRIVSAARGRRASLIFYGGCRNNPFATD